MKLSNVATSGQVTQPFSRPRALREDGLINGVITYCGNNMRRDEVNQDGFHKVQY